MVNWAHEMGIDLEKLLHECPIHPDQTKIESDHARKAQEYWDRKAKEQWQK